MIACRSRKHRSTLARRGGKSDAITGGYVHDIEGGRYPWVAVLDFKSMYPSIMISNNICHTTRVDALDDSSEVNQSQWYQVPEEECERAYTTIARGFDGQRDEHKALMKSANDEPTRLFHDQMQSAVKIL